MDEKDRMRLDIDKGKRLEDIQRVSGWQDIKEIFDKMYSEALKSLIEGESEKSRITLQALEDIYRSVTNGVKLGEEIQRRFTEKYGR